MNQFCSTAKTLRKRRKTVNKRFSLHCFAVLCPGAPGVEIDFRREFEAIREWTNSGRRAEVAKAEATVWRDRPGTIRPRSRAVSR